VKLLASRPKSNPLPRYFVVQKENDVIVLDLEGDKYYWKGNTRVDALAADGNFLGKDRAVKLDLELPNRAGFPPRGRGRYWRFDFPLVLRALFALMSAHRMVSKGFSSFADKLDRQLSDAKRDSGSKTANLAEIAAAMEWARLLFPFEAKCLPISIATARLARSFGIEANVVVGVQALPLKAHAWAQVGDGLINDFVDRVHVFRPIMSLPYEGAANG